jgi:hypothetical protein
MLYFFVSAPKRHPLCTISNQDNQECQKPDRFLIYFSPFHQRDGSRGGLGELLPPGLYPP